MKTVAKMNTSVSFISEVMRFPAQCDSVRLSYFLVTFLIIYGMHWAGIVNLKVRLHCTINKHR